MLLLLLSLLLLGQHEHWRWCHAAINIAAVAVIGCSNTIASAVVATTSVAVVWLLLILQLLLLLLLELVPLCFDDTLPLIADIFGDGVAADVITIATVAVVAVVATIHEKWQHSACNGLQQHQIVNNSDCCLAHVITVTICNNAVK